MAESDRIAAKTKFLGFLEEKNLRMVLQQLPALRNPTLSGLGGSGWVAVETVIEEAVAREIIPVLKSAGAEGII